MIVIHKYEKANRIYDYLGTLFGLLRFYNGRIYSNALTLLEIAGEGTPGCVLSMPNPVQNPSWT